MARPDCLAETRGPRKDQFRRNDGYASGQITSLVPQVTVQANTITRKGPVPEGDAAVRATQRHAADGTKISRARLPRTRPHGIRLEPQGDLPLANWRSL